MSPSTSLSATCVGTGSSTGGSVSVVSSLGRSGGGVGGSAGSDGPDPGGPFEDDEPDDIGLTPSRLRDHENRGVVVVESVVQGEYRVPVAIKVVATDNNVPPVVVALASLRCNDRSAEAEHAGRVTECGGRLDRRSRDVGRDHAPVNHGPDEVDRGVVLDPDHALPRCNAVARVPH